MRARAGEEGSYRLLAGARLRQRSQRQGGSAQRGCAWLEQAAQRVSQPEPEPEPELSLPPPPGEHTSHHVQEPHDHHTDYNIHIRRKHCALTRTDHGTDVCFIIDG